MTATATAEIDRPPVAIPPNQALQPAGATLFDDAMIRPFDVDAALDRLKRLRDFFSKTMEEGIGKDYGPPFPGSDKKQLYTGGADKLCNFYGVFPRPRTTNQIEQWGLKPDERPFFHFQLEVDLVSYRTGQIVAVGVGSANSMEPKYRYRKKERVCPVCGIAAIRKSNHPDARTGDTGWYCWRKNTPPGCGLNFKSTEPKITEQEVGVEENLEIQGIHHTILRIAVKRAKVHAVAQVTSSLGLLMEAAPDDDEDVDETHRRDTGKPKAGEPEASGEGHFDDEGNWINDPPKGSAPVAELITQEEHAKMYAGYMKAGHGAADVRAWLQKTYGVDITKQRLPKKHYDEVMKRVTDPTSLKPATGAAA